MSDQDPDRLPPELASLLAPEKSPGAARGKERVRARVEATIAGPPGGGGGSSSGGASNLMRAAAIFVAGGVLGGAAVYAMIPPREVVVEKVVVQPAPSAADTSSVALPIATHPIESAPSASASTTAAPSTSAPADSLAQERAILDPARLALGKGDAASALDAVHRHEQKFPQGKLTEEREAIAVQALVLAHQPDAARARGQKFLARWPGSVLRPAVEAALAAAAP